MDSLAEEYPTLPVDFDGSANPDHLAEVTFGANLVKLSDGTVGMVEKASSGRMSPVRARTMKEYDQEITELKKENFSLKLRIYFLEEKVQQKHGDDPDFKTTIELKIQVESLKKELMDKQDLLMTASNAMDNLSSQHQAELEQVREQARGESDNDLVEQLRASEQEIESYRQMLEDTKSELSELKEHGPPEGSKSFEESQRKIQSLTEDLQKKDLVIKSLESQGSEALTQAQQALEGKLYDLQNELQQRADEAKILEDQLGKEREIYEETTQSLKIQLQDSQQKMKELEIVTEEMSKDGEKKEGDMDKLEGIIRGKDDENKALKTNYDKAQKDLEVEKENAVKYQKTIQGLLIAIQDNKKEKDKLLEQIDGYEEELNKSRDEVHKANMQKYKNVEERQSEMNDKEGEIGDLQSTVRQQEAELKKLQKNLGRKDSDVDHLKAQLEKVDDLLKHKDDGLQELRDQLQEERQRSVEKLESVGKHYQTLHADIQRQLQNQETIVQRLTSSLQDKDRQLQEYIDMVNEDARTPKDEAHENMVKNLRERLKERDKALEEALEDKFKSLEDRDTEILKLKMSLRERDRDLERANHMLLSSEETIDSQDQEIKEKDKNIKELVNSLKSLQYAMDETADNQQRTLEEKDNIIRKLKQSLSSKDQQLQEALSATPRDDLDLQRQLRQKDRVLEEAISERSKVALDNEKATRELLDKLREKDNDIKSRSDQFNQEMAKLGKDAQWLKTELNKKEYELQMAANRVMWSEEQAKEMMAKMRSALVEKDKTIETLVESVRDKDKLLAHWKEQSPSRHSSVRGPDQEVAGDVFSARPGSGRRRLGRRASMPSINATSEPHKFNRGRRSSVELTEIKEQLSSLRLNLVETSIPEKLVNRRMSLVEERLLPAVPLDQNKSEDSEHLQSGDGLLQKQSDQKGSPADGATSKGKATDPSKSLPQNLEERLKELEKKLLDEEDKNASLKQQLNELLLTPDGTRAVSSGTVAVLKQQLNQANEKLKAKEDENNQLKQTIISAPSVNDLENEIEKLRKQLGSSENVCGLLKEQIQLNTQSEKSPDGFNPELIVQMAAEIERLGDELNKSKEKLSQAAKASSGAGGNKGTRIPTLKKPGQGTNQKGIGQSQIPTIGKSGNGANGAGLRAQVNELSLLNKQLANKVASTEATVRTQTEKMKYYRSLLEDAGLMPRSPRRSHSESNLSAIGSPLRKSRMTASTDNLAPLSPPMRGGMNMHAFDEFGESEDSATLKGQIRQLREQLERYQRIIKSLQSRIRFGSEAERIGFGSPLGSRRGSGQWSAMIDKLVEGGGSQDGLVKVQRENEQLKEQLAGMDNRRDADSVREQLLESEQEMAQLREELRIQGIKEVNMQQERDMLKRQLDDSRSKVATLRRECEHLREQPPHGASPSTLLQRDRGVDGSEGVSAILQTMPGERTEKVLIVPDKHVIQDGVASNSDLQREVDLLKRQLAESKELCDSLRTRLEEVQASMFEMLHQDMSGEVDCIDVTPNRVTDAKLGINDARELAEQLANSLIVDPDAESESERVNTGSNNRPQVSVGCSAADLADSGQAPTARNREPRSHHQGQGREDGDESSDSVERIRHRTASSTQARYPPNRSVEGSLDYLSEHSTTSSFQVDEHEDLARMPTQQQSPRRADVRMQPSGSPLSRASHSSSIFGSRDDVVLDVHGSESPPGEDTNRKRNRKRAFSRKQPRDLLDLTSTSENDDLPRHRTRPKVIGHHPGDEQTDSTDHNAKDRLQRSRRDDDLMSNSSGSSRRLDFDTGSRAYGQDQTQSMRNGQSDPRSMRLGPEDRRSVRSGASQSSRDRGSPRSNRDHSSRSPRSHQGEGSRSSQRAPTIGSQDNVIPQRDPWREVGKLKAKLQNAEELNKTLGEELRLYENLATSTVGIQSSPKLGSHSSQTSAPDAQSLLEQHLMEIRKLRERLEESIENNNRLREQLEQKLAQSDNSTLLIECQGLHQQLVDIQERLANRETELKENEKKRRDLELRLRQSLRKQSEDVERSDKDSELRETGLFNRQLQKLNDELRQKMGKYTEVLQLNEALQDDNDSLRNELSRRDSIVAERELRNEELKRQLKDKDGKVAELNDVVLQAKQQLEGIDRNNSQLKQDMAERDRVARQDEKLKAQLKQDCLEKDKAMRDKHNENWSLQEQLRSQENRVWELERHLREKDAINKDLQEQVKYGQDKLQGLQGKQWDAERELSNKKNALDRCERELKQVKERLGKEHAGGDLEKKYRELERVNASLNEEVTITRIRNKRLEDEVKSLKDRVDENQELNKTLRLELSMLAPPADGSMIDKTTGIDLTTLFEELRRLRIQLERCIENNNLLRERLEEDLARERPQSRVVVHHHHHTPSGGANKVEPPITAQSSSISGDHGNRLYSQELDVGSKGQDPLETDTIRPQYAHTTGDRGSMHYSKRLGSPGQDGMSYTGQERLRSGGAKNNDHPITAQHSSINGDHGNRLYSQELDMSMKNQDSLGTDSIRPQYAHTTGDRGNKHYSKRLDSQGQDGVSYPGKERLRSGGDTHHSAWSVGSNGHTFDSSSRLSRGPGDNDSLLSKSFEGSKYHVMDPPQTIDRSPVKVNTDHRMLYAVGRIDDYELLCKQINEALVIVKGTDARLKNRLDAFQGVSVSESLEYSTLRELVLCSNNMGIVLNEGYRLVRLFWTTQLSLDSNSILSASQREAFHEEEIEILKEKFAALENRYGKLLTRHENLQQKYLATSRRRDKIDGKVAQELSKSEYTLQRASGHFNQYLSRVPSRYDS